MNLVHISEKVQRLKNTFATGKTLPKSWRIEQLNNAKRMVSENAERIAEALNKDLNKCQQEAKLAEIDKVISTIDHTLKNLDKWSAPRVVASPLLTQPAKSFIQPEPLGTVLVIGAWNYPFQLGIEPVMAAISAGNCVVLKPSELAENTSNLLAELFEKYMDPAAFAVIEGGVDETTEVLKQAYDHILYTGGEAVGKIVMRAAAEHLTPVTLELGGKSPVYVDSSADINVTAARIAWGKFMNAGQTCIAPDYVLVNKAVKEQFIEALKNKITQFYGEDPAQSNDYGRIINERHHGRIVSYLEGQDIVFGGQQDVSSKYLAPTLVAEPDPSSALMQNEIFGPVLPIMSVENLDEAISFINGRPKPLAMYLFSKNRTDEEKLSHHTSAGTLCVNDTMIFMANHDLPFGGVGNSGMGCYHGEHGFNTFSHKKAVLRKPFILDSDVRYPPYNDTKAKILNFLS